MTWVIDTADGQTGVPLTAYCEVCGYRWERPDDDPSADTLPLTARGHRPVCPGRHPANPRFNP
ncbi:MAG TPA: hypothetical protein VGH66_02850 [Acidimicrobiales bacterium]